MIIASIKKKLNFILDRCCNLRSDNNSSEDASNRDFFGQFSESWNDEDGEMAILHKINPLRIDFALYNIARFLDLANDIGNGNKDIAIIDSLSIDKKAPLFSRIYSAIDDGDSHEANKAKTINGDSLTRSFIDNWRRYHIDHDYERNDSFEECDDSKAKALTLVDIGCGAGIFTEPMSKLGFSCIGVDKSDDLISVAKQRANRYASHEGEYEQYEKYTHKNNSSDKEADQRGQNAYRDNYQKCKYFTINETDPISLILPDLLAKDFTNDMLDKTMNDEHSDLKNGKFDIVTCFEVIEHVEDWPRFLLDISSMVRSGGILIVSSIDKTFASYLKMIVIAEHILKKIPRRTHQWNKFISPRDVIELLDNDFQIVDAACFDLDLRRGNWRIKRGFGDNYILCFLKL